MRAPAITVFLTLLFATQAARADPLADLQRGLAEAAPTVATRIRAHTLPPPRGLEHVVENPSPPDVMHPDSRRPVCDPEVVGVVTIDQAVRFMLPRALTSIGMTEQAARLTAIPPMHNGNEAARAGELVLAMSNEVRAHAPPPVARAFSTAVRGLGWSLLNLGRSRAAPESSVIRSIIQAAHVIVQADTARGPELVAEYAERVFRILTPSPSGITRCGS